jgi:hypothetical protein
VRPYLLMLVCWAMRPQCNLRTTIDLLPSFYIWVLVIMTPELNTRTIKHVNNRKRKWANSAVQTLSTNASLCNVVTRDQFASQTLFEILYIHAESMIYCEPNKMSEPILIWCPMRCCKPYVIWDPRLQCQPIHVWEPTEFCKPKVIWYPDL